MPTVHKFHWFWPFQDEQEERWLSAVASQGLHLVSVNEFGRYTFETGQPRDMVYRLDYRNPAKIDREDYLRLFADAGWEHAGQWSSWQYFRRPVQPGEAAEIFTDVDSKIDKYRRVSTAMLPFLALWIPLLARNGPAVQAVAFVLLLLYLYILTGLLRRISQLRKKKSARLSGPGDHPGGALHQ